MRKKFTLALLSLLLVPLAMMAQSVTVDPSSGKLIAVLSKSDTGFDNGWSGAWKHEQLPLTFTISDDTSTQDGQFDNPANNMIFYNNSLLIGGGQAEDSYWMLSLPKGYRFKGYKIVVLNNLNRQTVSGISFSPRGYNVNKVLYETNENFSTSNYKARGAYVGTTTYTMPGNTTNDTREYVIERNSETTNDMGNRLFFRLAHSNANAFYGVTVKSFTVYFTAEGTFDAPANPASSIDVAKSMVTSPFKTNKIDIGRLQNETRNGATYFAYRYDNVKDIDGYTYIYQDDATRSGIPMDVASKKKIFPVKVGNNQYFAFGNGVYYAEAPTHVFSQTGLTYPIGYRVVGAKFTPRWGSTVPSTSEQRNYFYIVHQTEDGLYYLNDQLRFTTERFGWYYDESTGGIYTGNGNNIRYLSCEGSGDIRSLTLSIYPPSSSSTNPGYYDLIVYERDSRTYVGWDANNASDRYYLIGETDASVVPTMVKGNNENAVAWTGAGVQTVTFPAYNPGTFTLNIYDKTGKTVIATKTVNAASDAGAVIDLTDKATYGYNNDAIKFEITGLPDGCSALVDLSLSMQALNPYIDQMLITCHDNANQLSLSQPFTAENFRVSGGQFKFYIPSEYSTTNLNFTFSDLWSQYGDNTYYTDNATLHKDGYARYSFVTSPYFMNFNDIKGDGTADGTSDLGLYDTRYVGTAENVQPGASIVYNDKVYATKAGNIRFKFNNAEGLSNTNPAPNTNYLEEYPFSAANYVGSPDPDNTSTTGEFVNCVMNAQDAESTTYYLFTADETRYNIAPSSAWQHRYYAFYRMEIDLQTTSYDPQLTWNTVYDETCYNKNGELATEPMYGLKLGTVVKGTTTPVEGYLTVKQIDDAITNALNKTGAPQNIKQILYVDGGDLYSIINSTVTSGGTSTTMTLETLKNKLADNALIYLPATTTSTLPNCAYKPSDWKTGDPYLAGSSIVLTDNLPFYAPYDIFVDVDKSITHERKVTVAKNGKVTSASIIMPFNILVDSEGKHTNLDGGSFKLHKMESSNCLTTGDGADYVYFPVLADVKSSTPNTPYLVEVLDAPDDDQISFVLSQNGGTIKATTEMVNTGDFKYTYPGETGSGTKDQVNYTFTNHGTYSGKQLAKDGNFFYFWKNQFVRSNDYSYSGNIKIAPFRTYYSSTSTGGAKTLNTLDITFEREDDIDGISTIDYGQVDVNAPVYDLQGRKLADSLLDSSLRKGVYVIKGMKVVLK